MYRMILISKHLFSVCENDWVSYSPTGGCYKYFPSWMSWDEASKFCQENVPYNFGYLASIPDANTNNFLQTLINDGYVWIGGFQNENSTWMWSDGTPWQYNNWYEGQPNNGGGVQTHVAFNIDSSGYWNDEYKEEENGLICYYKGDFLLIFLLLMLRR